MDARNNASTPTPDTANKNRKDETLSDKQKRFQWTP